MIIRYYDGNTRPYGTLRPPYASLGTLRLLRVPEYVDSDIPARPHPSETPPSETPAFDLRPGAKIIPVGRGGSTLDPVQK